MNLLGLFRRYVEPTEPIETPADVRIRLASDNGVHSFKVALHGELGRLHLSGLLDEAAELLKKWDPDDVCATCNGTGADENGSYSWDGWQPYACQKCNGTGRKSGVRRSSGVQDSR